MNSVVLFACDCRKPSCYVSKRQSVHDRPVTQYLFDSHLFCS